MSADDASDTGMDLEEHARLHVQYDNARTAGWLCERLRDEIGRLGTEDPRLDEVCDAAAVLVARPFDIDRAVLRTLCVAVAEAYLTSEEGTYGVTRALDLLDSLGLSSALPDDLAALLLRIEAMTIAGRVDEARDALATVRSAGHGELASHADPEVRHTLARCEGSLAELDGRPQAAAEAWARALEGAATVPRHLAAALRLAPYLVGPARREVLTRAVLAAEGAELEGCWRDRRLTAHELLDDALEGIPDGLDHASRVLDWVPTASLERVRWLARTARARRGDAVSERMQVEARRLGEQLCEPPPDGPDLAALFTRPRALADSGPSPFAAAWAVRSWSHGLVASPEDLASERIFGPLRDLACVCGARSGWKDFGRRCDTCGVDVALRRVRAWRCGHMKLAHPVLHPFARRPVAALLGLSTNELEDVVTHRAHVHCYGDHLRKHIAHNRGPAPGREGNTTLASILFELSLPVLAEESRGVAGWRATQIAALARWSAAGGPQPSDFMLELVLVTPSDASWSTASGQRSRAELDPLYAAVLDANGRLEHAADFAHAATELQHAVDALFDVAAGR